MLIEATDYGTVTISGAIIALGVKELFTYLNKRDANGTLGEIRDGINELVQDSRMRRQAEMNKAAAAVAAGGMKQ